MVSCLENQNDLANYIRLLQNQDKIQINLDQFRIIEQNKCLSGDSLFFDFLRINGEIHSDGHRNEKDCHGFGGGGKHGGKPLGVHDPEIVLFIYAFMGWSAYFHS